MSYFRPPTRTQISLEAWIRALTKTAHSLDFVSLQRLSRDRITIAGAVVDVFRLVLIDMESTKVIRRILFCPVKIEVVSGFLSVGACDELLRRLVFANLLDVLVGESRDVDKIPAALAFVGDQVRALRSVDPLAAETDFLMWRGFGRDVEAWFDGHFRRSRQSAA